MVGSVLALLDEHESLTCEQIAAHLGEPPDAVRHVLSAMRDLRYVEALTLGRSSATARGLPRPGG